MQGDGQVAGSVLKSWVGHPASRHPAAITLLTSTRTAVGAKQSGTGLDWEIRKSFAVKKAPLLHPCEESVSIRAALLGQAWQGKWEQCLVLDSRMLEMLNEKQRGGFRP